MAILCLYVQFSCIISHIWNKQFSEQKYTYQF